MNNALKQAVETFPEFTWQKGIAEELRPDLLSVELRRELIALGGQIVEKDGQLVVARADYDYMDLFDSNYQKVDLNALYQRVKAAPSFKSLTAEGAPKPVQPQPRELPELKTSNEAMRNAYRQGQEALADFKRNQQEVAEFEQRVRETLSQRRQVPAQFDKPYQPVNRSLHSRRVAAEQSLADFKRGQG